MELVAGPTLRQLLDQAGTLPAGEAVSIAAAVWEAVDVAHQAGPGAPRHQARQHRAGRGRRG
jgi:hypothetical protein